MNGSYKIALVGVAAVCVVILGYYTVQPGGEADEVASEDEPRAEQSAPEQGRSSEARAQEPAEPEPSSRDTLMGLSQNPGADEAPTPPAREPEPAEDTMVEEAEADEPEVPTDQFARLPGPGQQPSGPDPFGRGGEPAEADPLADGPDGVAEAEETAEPFGEVSVDEEPELDREAMQAKGPVGDLVVPEADEADEPEESAQAEASEPEAEMATHEVGAGDTLSGIARQHYGHERHWVAIARANPTVDPVQLRPGQELRLPSEESLEATAASEQAAQTPPGTLSHTVRPGETLSDVAARHYNSATRWRQIFEANRDVIGNDPNRVREGMELTIPPLPSEGE